MRDPRGSLWRQGDLHVHTPMSLVQNYGGDQPEAWDRFLADLEALPADFKVIGINDYLFLDGYRKVLEAKRSGRLRNIDLLLPVIELRIARFGGSGGPLSRVNLHIIFSDTIPPDVIQEQFLSTLSQHYRLDAPFQGLQNTWQAVATRQSLQDLGVMIHNSVPEDHKPRFTHPLRDGFNALNLEFASVIQALEKHYFRDKVVTAVGKTEWWEIQWTHGSVAEKKNIINKVNLVFTAAASEGDCARAHKALTDAAVNNTLLDCSDAHHFAASEEKERIGNCYTWINADTTFEGLRQGLREPAERIYLGIEPPHRRHVAQNPTKYIRAITIRKICGASLDEPWFDGTSLEFNPAFIAIIGNKGSGKSALVDILGLMGDTRRANEASFLSTKRFRNPLDNKAKSFEAEILWESGAREVRNLAEGVDTSAVERVTYIPQNVFEEICNELLGTVRGKFDSELKRVIFSHVTVADRLGCENLDALLDYRTSELAEATAQKREQLAFLNKEIVGLERRNTAEHRKNLSNQVAQRETELEAHDRAKPPALTPPPAELDDEGKRNVADLAQLQAEGAELAKEIEIAKHRLGVLKRELATVDRIKERLGSLRQRFEEFLSSTNAEAESLGLKADQIASLNVHLERLDAAAATRQEENAAVEARITPEEPGSLTNRLGVLNGRIQELTGLLNSAQAQYQDFLNRRASWEEARTRIVGDEASVGSLEHLKAARRALDELPTKLRTLEDERRQSAKGIHESLTRIAELFRSVHAPVQTFIERHPVARERFRLKFGVTIANANFEERFFDWIHQGRTGTFAGREDGAERAKETMFRFNFNDPDQSVAFADAILQQLRFDKRGGASTPTGVENQLLAGKSEEALLNFLYGFDYLEPRYELRMGERELHQLSPGEKGALLLVFYLLVDQNDTPILVDQPEENLDNQTIMDLLVPSLKEAKRRRQIFVVTHNPTLAVVCDAEQVVCALRGSDSEPKIRYESGAIENPAINRRIVDVLEGTRRSFDNRGGKYLVDIPLP